MAKDRIVLLDSLRGLGVLGILLCNIPDFAVAPGLAESVKQWPHGTGADTVAVWVITQWLFQRKFVTLFSMLFGISIFLVGGERPEADKGLILRKRLMWMVVFGLLHGFVIWYGDVLLSYALAGFAVMLVRSWEPRRLVRTGARIWAILALLMGVGVALISLGPHNPGGDALDAAREAAENSAAAAQYAGTFGQSLTQNVKDRASFLLGEPFIFVMTVSLMMLGLGCFKTGVFTGEASKKTYATLTVVGLVALAITGALYIAAALTGLPESLIKLAGWVQIATAPLTTLSYVSLMVFAARSTGAWAKIPKSLAPVGQMAFTNYLTQSLIMTTIFYGGRGLGLHGKLDRPALALIVVAVWIVQILWSRWWMDRFSMGPLEWLWRRLYRGPTPIRRATPA